MSRSRKKRKVKPQIFFFVEGKTEKVFFDAIKQQRRWSNVKTKCMVIDGQGQDWIEKTKSIIKNKSQISVDKDSKVFIIFDKNDNSKLEIQKMINKTNNDNGFKGAYVKVGFSNESFEIWLLSFYEKINKSLLSNKQVCAKLSKHLGKEYKKADGEQIDKIINDGSLEVAIQNTKDIREFSTDYHSSNIGEIFDMIHDDINN